MSKEGDPPTKRVRLTRSTCRQIQNEGQVVAEEDKVTPSEDYSQYINADCLTTVFSFLDFVSLFRVSRTCKLWRDEALYALKARKDLCLCSVSSLGSCLKELAKKCPNLESFHLFSHAKGEGIGAFKSSLKCLPLTEIDCERFNCDKPPQTVDEIQLAIDMICSWSFEVITLTHLNELKDEHVVQLIREQPCLKLLNIENCKKPKRFYMHSFRELLRSELEQVSRRKQLLEVRLMDSYNTGFLLYGVTDFLPSHKINILFFDVAGLHPRYSYKGPVWTVNPTLVPRW